MDILKDIEKNFLNINIYNKNADNAKLNIIKKQIDEYFKFKDEENNIIMEKKIRYEDKYKKPRDLNNYNYKQFLEKKMYLHNIYKETKSLSSLNEYLDCKIENYADIPEIYTYEYLHVNEQSNPTNNGLIKKVKPDEQKVKPKEPKVKPKDPKVKPKDPKVKPKEPKEPDVKPEAPKVKECPEGQILNPETNRCVDKKGVLGKKLLKNLPGNKDKK
jgi:hypothetical protein